ncbi:hypothetical protein [Flectobacillus roseus]|uniref:hypothetical protein n=1 Tax=Flectobacillus roseus TaxID=502259 RepID=UPI0024B78739|nr:hypothetical protein [Flectobacillus roseus]MDI9872124.1 hypothetical protein [Flectobacillus roseus]
MKLTESQFNTLLKAVKELPSSSKFSTSIGESLFMGLVGDKMDPERKAKFEENQRVKALEYQKLEEECDIIVGFLRMNKDNLVSHEITVPLSQE